MSRSTIGLSITGADGVYLMITLEMLHMVHMATKIERLCHLGLYLHSIGGQKTYNDKMFHHLGIFTLYSLHLIDYNINYVLVDWKMLTTLAAMYNPIDK